MNRDQRDETTRHRAAAAAGADVRTVDKVLQGVPVKGRTADRIRGALLALGIQVPGAPRWTPPSRRAN